MYSEEIRKEERRKYGKKQVNGAIRKLKVKPPPELLCECGRPVSHVADIEQLSTGGQKIKTNLPVCAECRKAFRKEEVRQARVAIELHINDYVRLQNLLNKFPYAATHLIGRKNQVDMESTIGESTELSNLLYKILEVK